MYDFPLVITTFLRQCIQRRSPSVDLDEYEMTLGINYSSTQTATYNYNNFAVLRMPSNTAKWAMFHVLSKAQTPLLWCAVEFSA